jgi:tRNA(Ile)-lysidine synthase
MMPLPAASLAAPQTALSPAEFAEAMAALGPWEQQPSLAVAVSGGSDSTALALLAANWARASNATLVCFIVDHGLRAESAIEAQQVRRWLESRGLSAEILSAGGAVAVADRGSVQEWARQARYRLLIDACIAHRIPHLLLAHHRGDQVETVLMRMVRGSGLRGMAAMVPSALAPGSGGRVRLLRPLLNLPKPRLQAYLQAAKQTWVEDPSNADLRHERVRWRRLMPVLEAAGVDPARLAEGAARFAEERSALDRTVAAWLAEAASPSWLGYVVLQMERFPELDPAIAEAVLVRVLGAVGGNPYPPRRKRLSRLLAARRRNPARLTCTLAGCVLRLQHGRLVVTREPAAAKEMCPARAGSLLWDGRFELILSGPPESLEKLRISALGASGLSEARQRLQAAGLPPLRAPAGHLRALPALWRGEELIEIPHIPAVARGPAMAAVAWAPRQPLTG